MSYEQDKNLGARDAFIREQAEKNRLPAATIEQQALTIKEHANTIEQLKEKVESLEELLKGKANTKEAKKPVFKENYSLDRNKRKNKKPRKKSTGRKPKAAKRGLATQQVDVYAQDADRDQCVRQRSQYAWRIIDGKAVYVCSHIYDLADSPELPWPCG